MMPPTSIDGTDITGATIDGTDVQEITVDGDTVFTAVNIPQNGLLHEWDAQSLTASDGDTIDPLPDQEGSVNLAATGAPSYETTTNISEPAVFYDGVDDQHSASSFGGTEDDTISIGFVIEPLRTSTKETFLGVDHSGVSMDLRLDNGVWKVTFPGVAEYTGGSYSANTTFAAVLVYDGSTATLDVGDTTPINVSTTTDTDLGGTDIISIGTFTNGNRPANFHLHYASIYDDSKGSQTREDIISALEDKFAFTSADG